MLIDEFLPEFDFEERHSVTMAGSADRVSQVLKDVDLCESWVVRWLFRLRGLPTSRVTLANLPMSNFETLGEVPGRELVLGLVGKFWTIGGGLRKIDRDSFCEFNEPGYAKAVWNFSVEPVRGGTQVTTETRIKCLDEQSHRNFGIYWMLIGPFSGLIRTEILKATKRKVEAVQPR
jgi:hypothetical protein